MHPHPEHPLRDSKRGFTLVELVIVIAVLGIMSAYAVMKSVSSAEMSLPSQAQTLASDIRHAQTLAYTSGKRMRFTSTNNTSYTYGACVTGSCPPSCTDFAVPLQKGVTLNVSPNTSKPLYFNTLGQPLDSTCNLLSSTTTYTLDSTVKVSVAPLTGLVHVCPPDPASTCP